MPKLPIGETITFESKSNSGVMEWVDADAAFERINTAHFMARWPNEDGSYQVAYCCHDEDANLYALGETDDGLVWRLVGDAPEYLVPALVPEFA